MIEIRFSKTAEEKYKYLVNGMRKGVNSFLDRLAEGKFTKRNFSKIVENEEINIYSKKCESIYIVLGKTEDGWFIYDLLTIPEYKEMSKSGIFII